MRVVWAGVAVSIPQKKRQWFGHCLTCGAAKGRVCRNDDNEPANPCPGRIIHARRQPPPLTESRESSTLARLVAQSAPLRGERAPPLTALQLAVLLFLEQGDGTATQMRDAWGISTHTIRPHTVRLRARGLLENVRRTLTITAKGRQLLRTAYRHRQQEVTT